MNTLELRACIQEEYLTNPLCEIAEEASPVDFVSPLELTMQRPVHSSAAEDEPFSPEAWEPSFEYTWRFALKEQLFGDKREKAARLAERLVDLLDPYGFLPYTIDELTRLTLSSPKAVRAARSLLMHLNPPGVGCRNVSEFLAFQLKGSGVEITPPVHALLSDYLPKLANMRYSEIARQLAVSVKEIQRLHRLITSLSPFPINEAQDAPSFVIPDMIVERRNGQWTVRIPEYAYCKPSLSAQYGEYMQNASCEADRAYISEQANRVRWIASAVVQRSKTLQRIGEELLCKQAAFFDGGPIMSMSQTEVAQALSVNKSTVCRSIAGKYLLCKRGLFPLSAFFSVGINAKKQSSSGGQESVNLSRESIKELIRQLISGEPYTQPLSDQVIAEKLLDAGVSVSRRTIAKYRSECGIRSASERRTGEM